MRVVLDIETDSLTPSIIWCCVTKDIDTGETFAFTSHEDLARYLGGYGAEALSLCVSHNGIGFDWPVLAKLWGIRIPKAVQRDTLVLSRLLNQPLAGGHSLEAWGIRLGFNKTPFTDFSKYTLEMEEYCRNDVHLNHLLYLHLEKDFRYPRWRRSIEVEHEMEHICQEMHTNGFAFNTQRARELHSEIDKRIQELDALILEEFKPVKKLERTSKVGYKKDGTFNKRTLEYFLDPSVEERDGTFYHYEWETFNPQSSKQICERLVGFWNPVEKTDSHKDCKDKERLSYFETYGWKISEANLATLTDDAPKSAHYLVERIMLGSRLRQLVSWLECQKDNRIHGRFNSLGTSTHRLSHTDPNLGNIATKKTIKYKTEALRKIAIHYGGEFRKLFIADEGCFLVGTDMEGAHLRIFAHLINDKELIQALVSGDKSLGTDPHTVNKKKLGPLCPDRDLAKTFIFTFLNGGGVGKVMEIFGCDFEAARNTLDGFIRSYPGLESLRRNRIPSDAKRGWFSGLDSRKVLCDSEHLMISRYLQNGEAVVMKHANILWQSELKKLQIPFKQVNFVHDEFQTVAMTLEEAHKIGEIQSAAIKKIGEELEVLCPLAGEYKIGKDWLEAH